MGTDHKPDVRPDLAGVERYRAAKKAAWERELGGPIPTGQPLVGDHAISADYAQAWLEYKVSGDAKPLAHHVQAHGGGAQAAKLLAEAYLAPARRGVPRDPENFKARAELLEAIKWHIEELGLTFSKAIEQCAYKRFQRENIMRRKKGVFSEDYDEFLFQQFQKLRGDV